MQERESAKKPSANSRAGILFIFLKHVEAKDTDLLRRWNVCAADAKWQEVCMQSARIAELYTIVKLACAGDEKKCTELNGVLACLLKEPFKVDVLKDVASVSEVQLRSLFDLLAIRLRALYALELCRMEPAEPGAFLVTLNEFYASFCFRNFLAFVWETGETPETRQQNVGKVLATWRRISQQVFATFCVFVQRKYRTGTVGYERVRAALADMCALPQGEEAAAIYTNVKMRVSYWCDLQARKVNDDVDGFEAKAMEYTRTCETARSMIAE
jgi:hypothetical protein